jgi:hypothetical protein
MVERTVVLGLEIVGSLLGAVVELAIDSALDIVERREVVDFGKTVGFANIPWDIVDSIESLLT